VRSQASRGGSCWSYDGCGFLSQQSGSGNNWALGYHKYGASVQEALLELLRKEVRAARGPGPARLAAPRPGLLSLGSCRAACCAGPAAATRHP
jgi:hypothetical protein